MEKNNGNAFFALWSCFFETFSQNESELHAIDAIIDRIALSTSDNVNKLEFS